MDDKRAEYEKLREQNRHLLDEVMEEEPKQSEEAEEDKVHDALIRFRERMMPYQNYIMIVGILILIMLVVFLGFAYGGMKVCSDLDGVLDNKFKCHPDFYKDQLIIQDKMIQGLILNVS